MTIGSNTQRPFLGYLRLCSAEIAFYSLRYKPGGVWASCGKYGFGKLAQRDAVCCTHTIADGCLLIKFMLQIIKIRMKIKIFKLYLKLIVRVDMIF